MNNKEDYDYLMSTNYNRLLEEDIIKYQIKSYSASQFNIYYIFNQNTTFTVSHETGQIINKFTKDESKNKISFFNLPSEISYNFHGNPTNIHFQKLDNKGAPDLIKFNYAKNLLLSGLTFYWHDKLGICLNQKLNIFFKKFFNESIFDITTDYDQSEILDIFIDYYLKGKSEILIKILKDLNIKNLDHVNKEYSKLIKMIDYN